MSVTMLAAIAIILSFFGLKITRIYIQPSFKIEKIWIAGAITLAINLLLLGVTALGVIFIPSSTPVFMVLSPVISVISWVFIKGSFIRSFLQRLQAFLLGFSVYFVLLVFFTYRFYTIKPSYPGEDMFMTGLGYMMGSIVCFFAILIGSFAFLLPNKKIGN